MTLRETVTLKISMEWTQKEGTDKKIADKSIISRIRSAAALKRIPWTLSTLRKRMSIRDFTLWTRCGGDSQVASAILVTTSPLLLATKWTWVEIDHLIWRIAIKRTKSRWLSAPKAYSPASKKSNWTHRKPMAKTSSLAFRDWTLITTVSTKWAKKSCVTHTTSQQLLLTHGPAQWLRLQTHHAVDKRRASEERRYKISGVARTKHWHRGRLQHPTRRTSKPIKVIT